MARTQVSRRDSILESAAALFASKGVSATTVREIADEVGVISASLYHHFESKEAIVDAIVSTYLDDLRARYKAVLALDGDPRTRLNELFLASLEVAERHPHATEIYQNDFNYLTQIDRFAYLKTAAREVRATWMQVINAGITEGEFRSDIDPKILYQAMRDALWQSVRRFKPTPAYPVSRLARECASLFLDGIGARPPAKANGRRSR
ncbi:MAG TPA: TetR/AcrR family transcriptional regulator [Rugosimonospora sp.]|nr:TetR/AcrR family transcriptional regulator [Rugosimonospora sp.]